MYPHTLIVLDSSRGNQYVLSSKSTHTHRLGFLSGDLDALFPDRRGYVVVGPTGSRHYRCEAKKPEGSLAF